MVAHFSLQNLVKGVGAEDPLSLAQPPPLTLPLLEEKVALILPGLDVLGEVSRGAVEAPLPDALAAAPPSLAQRGPENPPSHDVGAAQGRRRVGLGDGKRGRGRGRGPPP